MADNDLSPWDTVQSDLAIFHYRSGSNRPVATQIPVLLLHGPMTSHRTWDTLGSFLSKQGFAHVYAADIADVQMGASLRPAIAHLREVVDWIIGQYQPGTRMVLVGHSTGGVLARRYLLKIEGTNPILYLFTLGSPHTRTHFSYQVFVPSEELSPDGDSSASMRVVRTPEVPRETFVVNIFGNAVGPDFDGTVHGVILPEAVNITLPLGHSELKHDDRVMEEIAACLRGERYRMQLFLQSLHMHTQDEDGMVGPFYFEINGMRSPFDGIFKAEADHLYTFDDNSTPLATLAYPMEQRLVSTVFRLKDLSRARPVRRRLFAKLLDSLRDDELSIHELQDNEGSRIALRVHSQQMPALLNNVKP